MCFTNLPENVKSFGLPARMSDEALVAIAKTGNHSAFAELFVRNQKTLYRTVQRITGNVHDTEDVLQECSIKAFTHINTFDGRSAFSTWLVRIAINTALMMLRKRRRATVASLDDNSNSDSQGPRQIADASNNPEQNLLEREMQFQIQQAIKHLPTSLRIVMDAQRYRDSTTLAEVAHMTGLTVGATKSRLYRARLAVRHSMQRSRLRSL